MALYVWSLDTEPQEGANIGAGIMVLWVMGTIIVLAAAAIAAGVRFALRSRKNS